MKINILRACLAIAAVTVVLSGCLKSGDTPNPPPPTYLSIMHQAPTGPALDIFFDDKKASSTPFAPGYVTVAYNPVDKGSFSIKFKKANVDSLVADVGPAQYDSLNYYTIFLYNLVTDGPVRALRIKDDFTEVFTNLTKPYYRFFHASPNTGPVDLYIDTVKVQSGRGHADNAFNVTLNKFLATEIDVHNIQVRLAGTSTIIASLNNVLLQAGHAYTFYLKGLDGGTGDAERTLEVLPAFQ